MRLLGTTRAGIAYGLEILGKYTGAIFVFDVLMESLADFADELGWYTARYFYNLYKYWQKHRPVCDRCAHMEFGRHLGVHAKCIKRRSRLHLIVSN